MPSNCLITVATFFQVTSQVIASFQVPRFVGKWTRFAFRVSTENVTLFFNCNESDTVMVLREPLELVFDSASTLYIAQAGPKIQEPYEVSFFSLTSFRVFEMAFQNDDIVVFYSV